MNTHHLIPFQFKNHALSVITDAKGEPWWIAAEVCAILDLRNVSQALSRLDIWVTHEVLPQIRKTGQYVSPATDTWDVLAQIVEAGRQHSREIAALKETQTEQAAQLAALQATYPPPGKHSCVEWLRMHSKPFLPEAVLSVFRAACKRREQPERFRPASSQYEQLYYSSDTLGAAYDEATRKLSFLARRG